MIITNFDDFCIAVKENLAKSLPGNPVIRITDVCKNNGLVLSGITILYDGENISPNIYLNDFYHDGILFEEIEQISEEIYQIYKNNRLTAQIDFSFFSDYSQIKSRLYFKVINTEMNEKILGELPHIQFLDLSAVVYIRLDEDVFENGIVMVRYPQMHLWGIDEKTLFNDAYDNMNLVKPHRTTHIADLFKEIIKSRNASGLSYEDEVELAKLNRDFPMYVVSNCEKYYGASAILDQTFLSELSDEQDCDLYILPSSVHELIVIPAKENNSPWELKEMVKSVNATEVSKQEILSDNVYVFSKKLQKVYIAM